VKIAVTLGVYIYINTKNKIFGNLFLYTMSTLIGGIWENY